MRGLVDLPMPFPIAGFLPAVLQEDTLLQQWTEGLDQVVAPVIATLDCLDAYLDPWLTPPDFLLWLAEWVGAEVDENWPIDRRRTVVAGAAVGHRHRGTVGGLRRILEDATGGTVEVTDTGGVSWSPRPGPRRPVPTEPAVHLSIQVPDPEEISIRALDALVRAAVPVHVAVTLEVISLDRLS